MAKDHEAKQQLQPKNKGKVPVGLAQTQSFAPTITLLLFSTAMLTLPLATYFGIRKYIIDSTTFAALGAIVMVQIIIAAHIYTAWHEENKEFESEMKKKNKKER